MSFYEVLNTLALEAAISDYQSNYGELMRKELKRRTPKRKR